MQRVTCAELVDCKVQGDARIDEQSETMNTEEETMVPRGLGRFKQESQSLQAKQQRK